MLSFRACEFAYPASHSRSLASWYKYDDVDFYDKNGNLISGLLVANQLKK